MKLRSRACVIVVVMTSALVACGGGGGGGGTVPPPAGGGPTQTPVPSTAPTPTPTPRGNPFVLPSPSPVVQSAFSIASNPSGLSVTIDGAASGLTPQAVSPSFALKPHVVSIAPQGAGAPYTVPFVQNADGAHAIFFNAQIDTAGKIASIATSAVMRRTASAHALPAVRRMPPALAGRAAFSDRRLAVTYDASAAGDGIGVIERRNGVSDARTLLQSSAAVSRVVTIAPGHSIDDVRRGLAAERGVRSVERVRLRYPLASNPVYPNDPNFTPSEQWGVFQIGAPAAWGYGRGAKSVAIAVIDTGYDPNQPEVAVQVTVAEKVVGGRIDATAGAATDTDGHGTNLSGIASAATNNAVGWAGIAFGAALQEYKVFSDGANPTADSTDVAGAIREAVARKANVILLAVGGPADAGPDPFERDAVNFALANNVVVVAAAGNGGATTIEYPAGYGGVIAVGASALNDAAFPGSASGAKEYVPTYSNAAPGLTLVAPGGDPQSTTDTDQIHWIENAYTTQPGAGIPACAAGTAPAACGALFSGTSVAAAHVAGAAGLLLSKNAALTPAQVAGLLSSTADDIGDPKQGSGRLDLRRAMAALANDTAPFPTYTPANAQFIAFAYTNVGQSSTKPAIADVTYPRGVRVNADGTFRIADLPVGIGAYRIAVWYDVNGNGTIDAGDYVGVSALCAASGPCAGAAAIAAAPVAAGYVLP